MSNSLDFCRKIASDPSRSSFHDRNWCDAHEIGSANAFDEFLHGARAWTISGKDEDGNNVSINFELHIEPDAEFSYFTSDSSIHDGTLLFIRGCINNCIRNILTGKSYDKRIGTVKSGDTLHYTIGNFVILNEYDIDGTKFALQDKPFLHERTTVLLPVLMYVKE